MAREAAAGDVGVVEGYRQPGDARTVALGAVVAALYVGRRLPHRRQGIVTRDAVAGDGKVVHLNELKPAVLRVALVALPPGLDVPHRLARRDDLPALRMAAGTLLRRAFEDAASVTTLAPCSHMGADEDKTGRIVLEL